jgi:N-hydroxyarylamine O-acetyltransferase
MKQEQLSQYFQRIGYTGSKEPTFATLEAIQAAHAYAIPFETFDIALRIPIILELENIFDKLVEKKRGGYCYEVNALLHFALQSLGFKSKLCLARLMDDNQNILPASVHMVVIVEREGQWLVDVGWGSGFVHPFCIDSPTTQHGYRIAQDGDGYIFYREDKKLYRFMLDEHPLSFFEARNQFHQTSPDSPFAKEVTCSLPTPQGGFKMIRGRVFTTKSGEEQTESRIKTDEEYRLLLLNQFQLVLDNFPLVFR